MEDPFARFARLDRLALYEKTLRERDDLTDIQRQSLQQQIASLGGGTPPIITDDPKPPPITTGGPVVEAAEVRARAEAAGIKAAVDAQSSASLDDLELYNAVKERAERRETETIERQRGRTVSPGGVAPVENVDAGIMRPTRMERTSIASIGELYRDPTTGLLREPTAGEELRESFAQQTIMGEEEARRLAGRGDAPLGIMGEMQAGKGIVETPLAAGLRGFFGSVEGILGEAYVRGLGYEVDEEGNPKDTEDWAYQMRTMLDEVEEKTGNRIEFPTEMSLIDAGPVGAFTRGVRGWDPEKAKAIEDYFNDFGIAKFPMPFAPSTSTTQKQTILDPEGRMVVKDIEVPAPWEDFGGFVDAESRRLAANIAVGRGILDEVRDSPGTADFAEDVYGDPDWAYAFGVPLLFTTPATPIGLVTGAVKGASVTAKGAAAAAKASTRIAPAFVRTLPSKIAATRPGVAAANAARRASLSIDPVRRAAAAMYEPDWSALQGGLEAATATARRVQRVSVGTDPSKTKQAFSNLMGHAIAATDAVGQKAIRAGALIRPGRGSDALVNRRVTEALMRSAGVPDEAIKTIMRRLNFGKLTSRRGTRYVEAEAWSLISRAIKGTNALDNAQMSRVERLLKLNLPEDYVMVTDSFAAPRAYADELRREMDTYTRNSLFKSVEEGVEWVDDAIDAIKTSPFLPKADIAKRVRALTKIRGRLQKAADARTPTSPIVLADDVVSSDVVDKAVGTVVDLGDSYRYKVSAEINAMLPARLQGTLPHATNFAALDTAEKAKIIDGLKESALIISGGSVGRRAQDLGTAQVYLDKRTATLENMVGKFWDTPFSRGMFRLVNDPTITDLTKQSVIIRDAIRRAGRLAERTATRTVRKAADDVYDAAITAHKKLGGVETTYSEVKRQKAIVQLIKEGLTEARVIEEAINRTLAEGAKRMDLKPDDLWAQAFNLLYGEVVSRAALAKILDSTVTVVDGKTIKMSYLTSQTPTVKSLMAVDSVLAKSAIDNMASPGRFNTPDFQGIMMGIYLDEILRKELALAARERVITEGGLNVSLYQSVNSASPTTRSVMLDPTSIKNVQNAKLAQSTMAIPGPYGFNTPTFGLDMVTERRIAESPWEFVELLNKQTPKGRMAGRALAKQAAGFLAGNARLSIRQGMKYGWVTPNLRHFVFRGATAPFIVASQLGVDTALRVVPAATARAGRAGAQMVAGSAMRAVPRRLQTFVQRMMANRRGGLSGGITTPDGIYYSGEDLMALAEKNGVGYTSIQADRVFSLTEDILHGVRKSLPPSARPAVRFSALHPLQKTFWMRTAEAMERSFRQSVFETRLASGDTVLEAADAARRSLFDYDEVPGVVQDKLGKFFQGAATTYKLGTAAALAAMRNPKAINGYAKLMFDERKRLQDPYNIGGDLSVLNLSIPTDEGEYLISVPGSSAIVGALNLFLGADTAVKNMTMAWRAFQKGEAGEGLSAMGTFFAESGGPVLYSSADHFLGGVLRAFGEYEAVTAYQVPEKLNQMSDEKMLWAIMLAAKHLDPADSEGLYRFVHSNLEPEPVMPPQSRQHPVYTNYWTSVPENTPYIYHGRAGDGTPLYQVIEPSEHGKNVLKGIRALTPDKIERLLGAGVGLVTGGEVEGMGGSRPLKMSAGGLLPTDPFKAAMTVIANPSGMDFSKPADTQAQLAEEAVTIRETVP